MFWIVFATHYYALKLAIFLRQVRAFLNDPYPTSA